eukprot:3387895-Amphidinium_carterae.1
MVLAGVAAEQRPHLASAINMDFTHSGSDMAGKTLSRKENPWNEKTEGRDVVAEKNAEFLQWIVSLDDSGSQNCLTVQNLGL